MRNGGRRNAAGWTGAELGTEKRCRVARCGTGGTEKRCRVDRCGIGYRRDFVDPQRNRKQEGLT
ncbi:MAG TPA: hypothetical protein DCZ91_00535 [Lachnospiraceae bacterium]|nr:hypothetical protein [Lachnospiraceae bacterium]